MRCGQEVLGKFHVFSLLDKFHFFDVSFIIVHYHTTKRPKGKEIISRMKLNHNVYVLGKILSQRKPEFPLSPTCMNN